MLREYHAEPVGDFAERLDISRTTLYEWRKADRPTKAALGAVLAAYPNTGVRWLNTGRGAMLRNEAPVGDSARVGVPMPTGGPALLAEGEDYFGEKETMTLVIRPDTSIRPGAGSGGFEVLDLGEVVKLTIFKRFIDDLLGFWPPDTMEGLRIIGHSMLPTFEDGQLVLVDPVRKLGDMINTCRYVLSFQDQRTGDWTPLAKRIVTRPGGGFKIVSDNRAYGEDDMLLVPQGEDGQLHDHATGQPINMQVYGKILWPTDRAEREQVRSASDTLELLISEGALNLREERPV